MIVATAKIEKIVSAQHPESLTSLFRLIKMLHDQKRAEVALIILRQFGALGNVQLGIEHPLSRICEWSASLDSSGLADVVVRCMETVADSFESSVGSMHASTLWARLNAIIDMTRRGTARIGLLQKHLSECGKTLPREDIRMLCIRRKLAAEFQDEGYYAESMTLSQEDIAVLHKSSLQYSDELYRVAKCHYALHEVGSGIATMHQAIDLGMTESGPEDGLVRRWLLVLEDWYSEQGLWDSAAQVRDRRQKISESINID